MNTEMLKSSWPEALRKVGGAPYHDQIFGSESGQVPFSTPMRILHIYTKISKTKLLK